MWITRLCRAPGGAPGPGRVEPVFEDVEVKGAQVHDAIVVKGVIDPVEFETLVALANFFDQVLELVEGEPVKFVHLLCAAPREPPGRSHRDFRAGTCRCCGSFGRPR